MKAYEYNKIYKESLFEMLQNGKIDLSEVLFKYDAIDEYCSVIGYNKDIDIEEYLSEQPCNT